MRYTVGETYHFVRVEYQRHPESFGALYCPWRDTLLEFSVRALICTEHHKVPWEWDQADKLDRDGFLFAETDGTVWANQYPRASYGQTDNSQDWKVRRHFPREMSEDQVDVAHAKFPESELLWGITDARIFLETILRGLNPKSRSYLGDDAVAEREKLEKFRDYVVAKLEEASGRKIQIARWVINRKGHEPEVVEGVDKVSFVALEVAA